MLHGTVDVGGAAPAAFVRHRTAIAEPGQHQTVRDPAGRGVVSGEPGDRTDRPGHEEEPERGTARFTSRSARCWATARPEQLSFASEG